MDRFSKCISNHNGSKCSPTFYGIYDSQLRRVAPFEDEPIRDAALARIKAGTGDPELLLWESEESWKR